MRKKILVGCAVLALLVFGLYRFFQHRKLTANHPSAQVTPIPTPIPLGFATVVIQTEPKDARIYINKELKGKKSPVILQRQPNSEVFELNVKKKGYKEYTKIYNVESDRKMVLIVKLEKDLQ